MKRYKAHPEYELKSGLKVPGITTFLSLLAKPALVPWANKLGLQGIEVRKYVDELADIGTLAHYLIECDIRKVNPDIEILKDYTEIHKQTAKVCLGKYLQWKVNTRFTPLKTELKLVSEKYKYGGTIDLYGLRHGRKAIVDFKTGSGVYPEHFTQVSAGQQLLEENGMQVEERWIVKVGRSDKEGFAEMQAPAHHLHLMRFLNLVNVYNINKELGI